MVHCCSIACVCISEDACGWRLLSSSSDKVKLTQEVDSHVDIATFRSLRPRWRPLAMDRTLKKQRWHGGLSRDSVAIP